MNFENKKKFLLFLNRMQKFNFLICIGVGSQGICYYDIINDKVYKIFHQFLDRNDCDYIEYKKEEILKFSQIINSTFIWANDVIIVNDEIVGYISDFANARSLYKINPLKVDLEKFSNCLDKVKKDLKAISDHGVKTYDMMYNILYNKEEFFIIDHDDYSYSDMDSDKLYRMNCDNFNYEIMYFLIDNYFDEFISNYSDLKEMYDNNGVEIKEFIGLFKKYLSEYIGKNIVRLEDASECLNKKKSLKLKYQRILFNIQKNIDN